MLGYECAPTPFPCSRPVTFPIHGGRVEEMQGMGKGQRSVLIQAQLLTTG